MRKRIDGLGAVLRTAPKYQHRRLIVEDTSAGIDVPAAKLFQDQAKAEGQEIGIEYVTTKGIMAFVY